jgi:hypothetical protein
MTRSIAPATPLEDVLEKEWQRQVVQLAKTLGYRTYHTFDSRRSTHGFPDLVLVRGRVIYLELKRERGKLTDEQKGWLRAIRATGAEAYIARPRDLDALGQTLAAHCNAKTLDERTRQELDPTTGRSRK